MSKTSTMYIAFPNGGIIPTKLADGKERKVGPHEAVKVPRDYGESLVSDRFAYETDPAAAKTARNARLSEPDAHSVREAALKKAEADIAARETAVKTAEAALAEREATVAKAEADIAAREAEAKTVESALAERESAIAKVEADLKKAEKSLFGAKD